MNSIVFTHVTSSLADSRLHAALSRLGAYLDAESDRLESILSLCGQETAIDDIRALHALHLDPDVTASGVRQLLSDALVTLTGLLNRVQAIPLDAAFERAPSDFDAWQRWSGARLQDITATLSHALAD